MGVTELFRNPHQDWQLLSLGSTFPTAGLVFGLSATRLTGRENPAAPEVRPKGSCQLLPGNHSPNWWIFSLAQNQAQLNHNRRSVREDEHVASGRHQMPPGIGVILVILIICAALCLYCHYCFYSKGSSPLKRQILHTKRNEAVKPQCEYLKSSKEKLHWRFKLLR